MKDRLLVLMVILCIMIFTIPVYAYEITDIKPEGAESIEEDIRAIMPEDAAGLLKKDVRTIHASDWLSCLLTMMKDSAFPALRSLVRLFGMLIILSLAAALKEGILSSGLNAVLDFLSLTAMALMTYELLINLWNECTSAIENMSLFMNALLPIITALYALGGNTAAAASSHAALMALMTVIEQLIAGGLMPALKLCFGLALAECCGGLDLSGIGALLRHSFIVLLSFVMTIMMVILGYQSTLSASADNLAARTVKFAAGNLIPVVGGVLGDAVRTVAGSLQWIRTQAGILALLAVLLTALPVLIKLLLYRVVLSMTSAVSGMIGLNREKNFLGSIRDLTGLGIAAVSSCAVVFIFDIALFIRCAIAYSA